MSSSIIRICMLSLSILGISLLHYLTPLHLHYLHDIFQRLYYLPIILSALWYGFRGGMACSLVVSVVYAPHVLFQWGGGITLEMEKYLEIVLYNIVGGVTGLLSQRERDRSIELQKTAAGLADSYNALQLQSERIISVEEQLRRSERLSTLGEMAAVLAHEIRNPLGSIRGTAEILMDDYKPGDPKHEFIEIQIKETERLNRVVEDFLRMSKPQSATKCRFLIRDELETVLVLTAKEAKERQVRLWLEPSADNPVILGDSEKLRQAFLNIVINALQATPAGGIVTIQVNSRPDLCEISFRDSGAGIDQAAMGRIFEPFFTTKPDGTGLGLVITKKIIEGHGGSMLLHSEPGNGTTVTIMIPNLEKES
jgi:two-component system, NtrC family, sensor histidine kinase HydH